MSLTGRGVLSSSVSPMACASRRAGSIVSTTVRRPASAARSAIAAAVVVFPTPPLPQVTTMRVARSRTSESMSRARAGAGARDVTGRPSPGKQLASSDELAEVDR